MEVIELNTVEFEKSSSNMYGNKGKSNFYNSTSEEYLVSIFVVGYKHLEKTKRCVESILKYTNDISYELILFDNHSEDGTAEYFKSIEGENVKVICSKNNLGSVYACNYVFKHSKGKYIAFVANDVYVTKNWLNNLLICMESNTKIGMAVPTSSNVSNLQDPGFVYETFDEMYKIAEKFNVSNPSKWEERIRLINPCFIISREAYESTGYFDYGYIHDFSEDDYCFRLRRAGYKLILCGDVYVCHDHARNSMTEDQVRNSQLSLQYGREYFNDKFKLHPWDEVMSMEYQLVSQLEGMKIVNKDNKVLGVEVRCGESLMWINNVLRLKGLPTADLTIINKDAKYYADNITITPNVTIDNPSEAIKKLSRSSKDIIILGKALNEFDKPLEVLADLMTTLSSNGILMFKLLNTNTYENFLSALGYKNFRNQEMLVNLEIDDLLACLNQMPIYSFRNTYEWYSGVEEIKNTVFEIFDKLGINNEDAKNKLFVKEYYMCVQKK